MRRRVKMLGLLAILASSIVIAQNCTGGFDSQQANNQGSSGGPGGGTPPPPGSGTPLEPSSNVEPTLQRTDFMTGLSNPWDLAFTPDNAMLFTERCNGLSVRRADGSVTRLFGSAGSALVAADMFCEGQSGMLGVAVDPNFATNRTIYVYMASNLSTNPRTNRVIRLTVDAGYTMVANRTDIITDIAYKNAGNSWGGAGAHSGGRLRFGPDGYLYVTTGDNHNGPLPQDLTRLGGKVLRVTGNGTAAPGNNAPAGADPRIFTFGHRNVQGIAFRPGSNQPFSSEHGPGHTDEVTPLAAGGNSGWDPRPEAGVTCNDNYCGYVSNKTNGALTPMTDTGKFVNAMMPVYTNNGQSQGMGPSVFLYGTQWKAWEGSLLVGVMAATRLDRLRLNANNSVASVTQVGLPAQRIRSLVQGPDGNLYVATDSGSIWRVVPQ
ncbi:MAG: sorbosone dehydrogenase family protein [Bdellovibrionales bacterium]